VNDGAGEVTGDSGEEGAVARNEERENGDESAAAPVGPSRGAVGWRGAAVRRRVAMAVGADSADRTDQSVLTPVPLGGTGNATTNGGSATGG